MNEREFEKQTLDNLLNDLKDIDKYTSFKNGAFIYDLGKYQGTLLVNHIEQLQQENKQLKEDKKKAIEYIKENCILSDEWTDLGFCNFIPTGKITYKQLTPKKVKKLLEILGDKE